MSENQYKRPSVEKIKGDDCKKALEEYFTHYINLAENNRQLLNQKISRETFKNIINRIGVLILEEAKTLSENDSVVKSFLEKNTLPPCLKEKLTNRDRTFALLLNALGQWVTCEKLAIDRLVMAGNPRKQLKLLTKKCLITSEELNTENIQLHHPVRDGRPPIPISKKGHELIEDVNRPDDNDKDGMLLFKCRKESKRSMPWKRIRIACLLELNRGDEIGDTSGRSKQYKNSSKSILNNVKRVSKLSAEQILDILDRYELGIDK